MASNNLEYTLRLKDLFSKTMQGAAKETAKLDDGLKKSTQRFSDLRKAAERMQKMNENARVQAIIDAKNKESAFTKISTAAAVGWGIAGAGAVSFGKAVIESLKNYEYFHAGLRTMLHGNENATKALESQLINLAKTTPFQLTEVQDATKQLLAYGFKAGDVVDTMRTLGDVSAGIGAPLGDIAYLYGTLKTSGRVTLMDLRQFAGRGIPIYEVLAKRLKVTTNEINKMVSSGKIGFKDIEGAFKDMTSSGGQFFNLMADQSQTVGGKISNLGDVWEQIKVKIGNSQKGIIASTLDMVNNFLNGVDTMLGAQNKLDESLSKNNLKLSFWDKLKGNKEGLPSMVNDITAYQLKIDKINESSLANDLKAYLLKKELNKLDKERLSGAISLHEYQLKTALLQGGVNGVKGLKEINSMKENKSSLGLDSEGGKSSKSLGTGTEVSGNRPQSLTINITKLVEELNVQTTNLTEGTTKIKELVSKALLEAVNDINQTAMA